MIAFSTCWNSGRHIAGDEMLREIKTELGFDSIELGHGIRLSLMPGIQKMFDSGQVRFSSLHNFCPLPVDVMLASPNSYQFSAVLAEERERAVRQTFQTTDFAERLGAPFVVLHLGSVRMRPITDRFIQMTKAGKHFSRGYDHAEWLTAIGPRAFGCHVQDCIWPERDHERPFRGGIDFEKLVPLLHTNCLFVWKMSPNKTADAIRQSVRMWKERFGG